MKLIIGVALLITLCAMWPGYVESGEFDRGFIAMVLPGADK